jgi:putative ABC transport system substrate-binding protein
VRRRDFIAVFGGAAAWPLAGRAQQSEEVRRLGVLLPYPESDPVTRAILTAFTDALARLGWVVSKNIRIDYRFAAGDPTLYKIYAAELVGLSPDAIFASASPAVAALRQQKRTIPVVFVQVVDPVGLGFVQSLARPGGNITGFSAYDAELMGKWLQLLREIAPRVIRVAVIFNPDTAPFAPLFNRAIESAAPSVGMAVKLAPVHDDAAIEEVVAAQAQGSGSALICLPESFSITHRNVIIAAAAHHNLPLIGGTDVVARAGALLTYWENAIEVYAKAAPYIDRIFKGASPAELPVQQPTKFSLVINLKTAKALGLTVPPAMLDLADEVIE